MKFLDLLTENAYSDTIKQYLDKGWVIEFKLDAGRNRVATVMSDGAIYVKTIRFITPSGMAQPMRNLEDYPNDYKVVK